MAGDKTTTETAEPQTPEETQKQAKSDALSPSDKHKNYLADLKRIHEESVVDAHGNTPRAG